MVPKMHFLLLRGLYMVETIKNESVFGSQPPTFILHADRTIYPHLLQFHTLREKRETRIASETTSSVTECLFEPMAFVEHPINRIFGLLANLHETPRRMVKFDGEEDLLATGLYSVTTTCSASPRCQGAACQKLTLPSSVERRMAQRIELHLSSLPLVHESRMNNVSHSNCMMFEIFVSS